MIIIKKILSNINNKYKSFKYIIDYYKYIINQENFINHNW